MAVFDHFRCRVPKRKKRNFVAGLDRDSQVTVRSQSGHIQVTVRSQSGHVFYRVLIKASRFTKDFNIKS